MYSESGGSVKRTKRNSPRQFSVDHLIGQGVGAKLCPLLVVSFIVICSLMNDRLLGVCLDDETNHLK